STSSSTSSLALNSANSCATPSIDFCNMLFVSTFCLKDFVRTSSNPPRSSISFVSTDFSASSSSSSSSAFSASSSSSSFFFFFFFSSSSSSSDFSSSSSSCSSLTDFSVSSGSSSDFSSESSSGSTTSS